MAISNFGDMRNINAMCSRFSVLDEEKSRAWDLELKRKEKDEFNKKCYENFCSSGIAEKFKKAELSDLSVSNVFIGKNQQQATMQVFYDFVNDIVAGKPRMFWFCGNPGTGKTTLASAIMHEICKQGILCDYYKSHRIMQDIKNTDNFKCENTAEGIIKNVCYNKFRVIDEIGRYPLAEWEKFRVFEITNNLYEQYKSAIYITNMSSMELAGFMGAAATDRFRGLGLILEFKGETYRGSQNELYIK